MDLCGHTERKAKQEGYLGYLLIQQRVFDQSMC